MTNAEILAWLKATDEGRLGELFARADAARREAVGKEVHLRGLIEFGNYCRRNCAYCGLRAANKRLGRFRMTREEVLDLTGQAAALGYGTVVLQSGEDEGFSAEWIAETVREILRRHRIAVTLSVGERSPEEYRLWREAGADRCLLKFETSQEGLYRRIHPPRRGGGPTRLELLLLLREQGYEIGSGIMIGLPGQTWAGLARDIELFSALDIDMIGVGPYLPHPDTPLGRQALRAWALPSRRVPNDELTTLKTLALTRLLCPTANIPATTALATVDSHGFEKGLRAGANVIMPNLTPLVYRRLYDVYPNTVYAREKLNEIVAVHNKALAAIHAAGRVVGVGKGGRSGRKKPR